MKNLNQFLTCITLFGIILVSSCQSDEEQQNLNPSNDSIEIIIDELQELANTKGRTVIANIIIKNDRFSIAEVNIMSQFDKNFYEGFKQISSKLSGAIIVSCSDGTMTVCESGFGQIRCVGQAIKNCLDKGGCAEVCSAEMVVEPE